MTLRVYTPRGFRPATDVERVEYEIAQIRKTVELEYTMLLEDLLLEQRRRAWGVVILIGAFLLVLAGVAWVRHMQEGSWVPKELSCLP